LIRTKTSFTVEGLNGAFDFVGHCNGTCLDFMLPKDALTFPCSPFLENGKSTESDTFRLKYMEIKTLNLNRAKGPCENEIQ
jgi:hypothetical protein